MSGRMDGIALGTALIRAVVRAFYETRHVLIIECLLNYSAYEPSKPPNILGQPADPPFAVSAMTTWPT